MTNIFPNLVTYHLYDGSRLPPYDAPAYQYIVAGNGVFVRTETPLFAALVPITACTVRGLEPLQPDFTLKVPRIPEWLLQAALTDARRARRPDGGLNEVLYQFLRRDHAVQLLRPAQRATGVSVTTPGDSNPNILCELHSHGNMHAFWSATDDADEQGARIYAVIGRLDTAPEIHVRVGVYGYWMALPTTAVFTGAGASAGHYMKEK